MNNLESGRTPGAAESGGGQAERIVLQVFHRLDRGGAEMRTLDLIRANKEEGFRFAIGVFSKQAGALDQDFRAAGCEIVQLSARLGGLPSLLICLLRRKPDVLHTHSATASGAYLLAASVARIPVRVAHFRSDGDGRPPTIPRAIQRGILRTLILLCATHVLGVSPEALRFAGIAGRTRRSRVIPNGFATPGRGFDLPESWPVSVGRPVVTHVGRSNPAKNRDRALRVLAAARAKDRNIALVMLGGVSIGEDRELRELARRLRIEDAVHFCGSQDDVLPWLKHSAAVLNTSRREGLPGVLLEALSVGTPFVASDLAGACWIASLLPGAHTLDLEASDDDWALAVLSAASVSEDGRTTIASQFRDGPFTLDRALAMHRDVWMGS